MLEKYKTLIQSLPIDEMGFATKKAVWEEFHTQCEWLKTVNKAIFCNNAETLNLTRGELKIPPENLRHFILKVIYWGYARGMRGNHFKEIIEENNIQKLENLLKTCNSISDFEIFFKEVESVKGIGISTFTKFLYFLNVEVEGCKALILDDQIIQALSKSPFRHQDFEKLERRNAHQFYLKYLQKMAEWAKALDTQPENVEMFLFMFHKSLKPNGV